MCGGRHRLRVPCSVGPALSRQKGQAGICLARAARPQDSSDFLASFLSLGKGSLALRPPRNVPGPPFNPMTTLSGWHCFSSVFQGRHQASEKESHLPKFAQPLGAELGSKPRLDAPKN